MCVRLLGGAWAGRKKATCGTEIDQKEEEKKRKENQVNAGYRGELFQKCRKKNQSKISLNSKGTKPPYSLCFLQFKAQL
jgi:hypothetical protein